LPFSPITINVVRLNGGIIYSQVLYTDNTLNLNSYLLDAVVLVNVRVRPQRPDSQSLPQAQAFISFIINGASNYKGQIFCVGNFCKEEDAASFTVYGDSGYIVP
jgi:hypothetical protein